MREPGILFIGKGSNYKRFQAMWTLYEKSVYGMENTLISQQKFATSHFYYQL